MSLKTSEVNLLTVCRTVRWLIALAEENGIASKFSEEEAEDGSRIVTEFLRSWASDGLGTTTGSDDVIMADESSTEDQLIALKRCYEQFRPQIEASPWCQAVLSSLWLVA